MSRFEPWLPVIAAVLFVTGSAVEIANEPAAPARWCWLLGSLLFLLHSARRARRA